jgi:hypothetical protein
MNDSKDKPAFPMPMTMMGGDIKHIANEPEFGMTSQVYAAIHLRVPQSGIEWLDEMIKQSKPQ